MVSFVVIVVLVDVVGAVPVVATVLPMPMAVGVEVAVALPACPQASDVNRQWLQDLVPYADAEASGFREEYRRALGLQIAPSTAGVLQLLGRVAARLRDDPEYTVSGAVVSLYRFLSTRMPTDHAAIQSAFTAQPLVYVAGRTTAACFAPLSDLVCVVHWRFGDWGVRPGPGNHMRERGSEGSAEGQSESARW